VTRRGALLLELLISIAVFAAAAMFTLAAMRHMISSLDRAATRQAALDEARSIMSRLEAGDMNVSDLRGSEVEDSSGVAGRFRLRAKTSPTEFRDLTLVDLEILTGEGDDEHVACRLRQLVPLRPSARAFR
jgi:hypothetical protein